VNAVRGKICVRLGEAVDGCFLSRAAVCLGVTSVAGWVLRGVGGVCARGRRGAEI